MSATLNPVQEEQSGELREALLAAQERPPTEPGAPKLDQAAQEATTSATPPQPPSATEQPAGGETKSDESPTNADQDEQIELDEEDKIGEDFVHVNLDEETKYEHLRASFYTQMEKLLTKQTDKCEYYLKWFEKQGNTTLANTFATHATNTRNSLDLLKLCWRNNAQLPKHKIEIISLSCVPVNVDVRDKELQLIVKTSQLDAPKDSIYVVGEFAFPYQGEETVIETIARRLHYATIEPRNFQCCPTSDARQLDIIYATDLIPFTNPESQFTEYSRPMSFFVDKGKSRTLKRKFKPIRLTFYQKTGLFRLDKKLGYVQVKIDDINDECTLVTRQQIYCGRKMSEALADIRIKVREPLVEKTIRAHEEKLLVLI